MTKMSLVKDYPNLFETRNGLDIGTVYLFFKSTNFVFNNHSKKILEVDIENDYPTWRLACLEDLLESEEISINLKEQILFHLDLFR